MIDGEQVEFELSLAEAGDAAAITEVLADRAPTLAEIERAIAAGTAVLVHADGELAGAAVAVPITDGSARLAGLAVRVGHRRLGIGSALIQAVTELAAEAGGRCLIVELDDAATIEWAERRGFVRSADRWERRLPEVFVAGTAEAMQALGEHLAGIVTAGDLIIATGDLGAGKTTLTQGLGRGLGVDEPVTSPTFVLSRVYAGSAGRPDLVHVDAYRLGDAAELDDIDLDTGFERAVTLVEWGAGLAEQLSPDRLEIDIRRGDLDEGRVVYLLGHGDRWQGVRLTPEEER